jgi:solute carrier family 25 S-adenosylmethionine transporter 26
MLKLRKKNGFPVLGWTSQYQLPTDKVLSSEWFNSAAFSHFPLFFEKRSRKMHMTGMIYFLLSLVILNSSITPSIGKPTLTHLNLGAIRTIDSNTSERRLSFIPDGIKNAMASGLATAVVKTFLQPLDTIKTIQQAQKIKLGPIKAAMQIIEQRGIRGLWSGIGITVVGSTPSVAVYFGVYSTLKSRLTQIFPPELKLLAVALSAAVGNTFASVLRVPYEVLKQRIQTGRHQSAWEAVVFSWKNDGPLGLFDKGKLSSQIIRDIPYAIITLVSYEILQSVVSKAVLRQQMKRKELEESNNSKNKVDIDSPNFPSDTFFPSKKIRDALCGSVAGGLGSFLTTPMDVVKTRMMTGTEFSSISEAFYRILKEEGVLTFFVGVGPRLTHKIPANGLFFLCYEAFRTFLQVDGAAGVGEKKA